MRLFVAVNVPGQLRQELSTRLDSIRERIGVAWTRPETWHLTLMFLDEWPQERVPGLIEALRAAVAVQAPLVIQPGTVGAFPNLRRPRVLFLHLDGGDALQQLASTVRTTVNTVWPDGPQDRKDFRPHVTLARVKRPLPGPESVLVQALDLGTWEPFTVDRVALVASRLRSSGAVHGEVASLALRG